MKIIHDVWVQPPKMPPSSLFIPYCSEVDYLLAWVGEKPVGTLRLHWEDDALFLEKLSVLGGYSSLHVWSRLFDVATELAMQKRCVVVRAYVWPKHRKGWRFKKVETYGAPVWIDGSPSVPIQKILVTQI